MDHSRKRTPKQLGHCLLTRRSFLKAASTAALLSIPGLAAAAAVPAARRPNILFILTDDQGPWAWGGGGHPDARTPNLDRLRAEGALLANYFVTCPVCSPARASLISSRYPTEVGIPDYLGAAADPGLGLDPALPAWPRLLQHAGYRTALIGKWHLGDQDRYLPEHFGYEHFAGFRHGGRISKDPDMEIGGEKRQVPGYTTDILADLALDFIQQHHDESFLVSLHFFAPHANVDNRTADGDRTWLPQNETDWAPFQSIDPTLPEPAHPKLDVPRAKRMTREYLASVAGVDRNVGRILDTLERLGLADNTIVVFTSDHGYNLAHHGIWHKGNGWWLLTDNRGPRPNLWDSSLKAPALVRWPAAITPGSTVERTTSNLDWFPTLLAMAGVALPADALLRGRNFLPLLKGESVPWDDDFFAQYDQWESSAGSGNLRAYRTPDWKLVRDFRNAGKDELYHLAVDPKELNNLIDSADPEVHEQRAPLEAKLQEAMARLQDRVYREPQ
ncbi:MAG: sulfatase-like hydrolase/transferase [Candidatus Hydrogenedentes bacterium]|nr:sulfatase-like hydrolase/transferase [Candidatus Hydrogenedentota bacterium]